MDLNFKLSELSFETVGSWPKALRWTVFVLVFSLVVGVGYWLDTSSQLTSLMQHQDQEQKLRAEFEKKEAQALNLEAYRKQLIEMRHTFGNMLMQLPSKTEVPALLEDISKSGVASGLEFKLFDPLPEVKHDFFAELPIRIIVVGHYHQFGDFVGRIAALDRIVTLHNFNIIKANKNDALPVKNNHNHKVPADILSMEITAKTYRYLEGPQHGA
jgi:type IV pilus assembly protein PilO